MHRVMVCADQEELAARGAEHFAALAAKAIEGKGLFRVALSGGGTPKLMYCLLSAPPLAKRVDWASVHVFWGDERCVPPTHPESNYRLAQETLLERVPIPQDNVHRIRGELDPQAAASDYAQTLRKHFGLREAQETPQFDLIFLGLGADGHTASLFPNTDALKETSGWVAANYVEKLKNWRITLTAPAINAAAQVTFLVAGEGKAKTLKAVLEGSRQPRLYPSQLIEPAQGDLLWLVDEKAASLLESR